MKLDTFFDQDIAVIVPVYNHVDKLHNTLNALEGQFFKNFLVVLIDDGSDKEVKEECLKHKNNLNIYYIRNETNLGVAKTRQKALDFVLSTKIPYLIFVDGDDLLLPGALQEFFININYGGEDICVGDKRNIYEYLPGFSNGYHKYENTVWITNKMFRTSFIKEHNLHFKDFPFHEDLYFNLMALNCFPTVKYLNNTTYLQINYKTSYTETVVNHSSKICGEYTLMQAVYSAILESEKYHFMTLEYFIASYRDYQICKARNIDLTEIDEMLYKIGKILFLDEVDDKYWADNIIEISPLVAVDKNYADYGDIEYYMFFEESFYQWAHRYGFLEKTIFPVQSKEYFLQKKYVNKTETEWI